MEFLCVSTTNRYLLLAALVLGLTAKKTFTKYQSTAAKEKKAREALNASTADKESAPPVESAPVAIVTKDDIATTEQDSNGEVFEPDTLALRKQYLEEDMRQYPKEKIASLVVLWMGLFIITLMKGGKGVDSIVGITCESPVFSVLIVIQFLWLFGFATFFGWQAYKNQAKRVAVDYPFLPGDPIWDGPALKMYGVFTFIAGVVAGLIGIGGGMVLGPLMLIMGIDARVS